MKKLFRLLMVPSLLCVCALGQSTESVLHSFMGAPDGAYPSGGLLFDAEGNIYGTTFLGGTHCPNQGGCGTVYELSPSLTGYTETVLYSFCTTDDPYTCPDGAQPYGGLISDNAGNLYGTTPLGGHEYGTVFELSPPSVQGGAWTETVLWEFGKYKGDGDAPGEGKLNWDASGNLYGTTAGGGASNHGTVFELSPGAGGSWTETVLLSFSGGDGDDPLYGVAIDAAGNLYGTTNRGGIRNSNNYCEQGCGTIFELAKSSDGWTERVYRLDGAKGANPQSNISIDAAGNLYGTTQNGGEAGQCNVGYGCGSVFKLVPQSGGGGRLSSILFNSQVNGNPYAGVLIDGDAIFGTATWGDDVYEIKDGVETIIYQFCSLSDCADGKTPAAGALVSHDGLLYGVTEQGGYLNNGVVYSVTK